MFIVGRGTAGRHRAPSCMLHVDAVMGRSSGLQRKLYFPSYVRDGDWKEEA